MTIDEAIKLQINALGAGYYGTDTPLAKAMKLGIEALKEVKESRIDPSTYISHPLLGETEK